MEDGIPGWVIAATVACCRAIASGPMQEHVHPFSDMDFDPEVGYSFHPFPCLHEMKRPREMELRKLTEPFSTPGGEIQTVHECLLRIGYQKAPRPLVPAESVEERWRYSVEMTDSHGGAEHLCVLS